MAFTWRKKPLSDWGTGSYSSFLSGILFQESFQWVQCIWGGSCLASSRGGEMLISHLTLPRASNMLYPALHLPVLNTGRGTSQGSVRDHEPAHLPCPAATMQPPWPCCLLQAPHTGRVETHVVPPAPRGTAGIGMGRGSWTVGWCFLCLTGKWSCWVPVCLLRGGFAGLGRCSLQEGVQDLQSEMGNRPALETDLAAMPQWGIPGGQASPFLSARDTSRTPSQLPYWSACEEMPVCLDRSPSCRLLRTHSVWARLYGLVKWAGELPEAVAHHHIWCFLLEPETLATLPCSREFQQFHFHAQPRPKRP